MLEPTARLHLHYAINAIARFIASATFASACSGGSARNAALNGSHRTGASHPNSFKVFKKVFTSKTPVANGSSRCESICWSAAIPAGASFKSTDTMSAFVSVFNSAAFSPAICQCHESSTNPTFPVPIAPIKSLHSAIVCKNGKRRDVHSVFGPTYSNPNRCPLSLQTVAIARNRSACCFIFCEYVNSSLAGMIQVDTRFTPAAAKALATAGNFAIPASNVAKSFRYSTVKPAEPHTSRCPATFDAKSFIWLADSPASVSPYGSTAS